jgi:hypothetical protein
MALGPIERKLLIAEATVRSDIYLENFAEVVDIEFQKVRE